ncbi:hypothetical protein N9M66_06960, partial [Litoreibacter sp.]|nr:hypothetical protein [Litoreibacter sp.]
GQMMDMAKQRAMSGALDAGQEGITEGITSALAPSAGAANAAKLASTPATMGMAGPSLGAATGAGAGMAAIGTAVPYIGAGLLAGKALGLFNEGGQVGPLSTQYHAEGYVVPGSREYNIRMLRNKADRLEEPVMTSKDKTQSSKNFTEGLRQLRKQQDFVYPMIVSDYGAGLGTTSNMQSGVARMAFTDDPIAKRMYDVGNAPLDTSSSGLMSNYIGYPIDDQGYTARGFEQGGQIGMSKEQAMALMNNQPDPDELYNEIVAESMTEAAQQQMPQPKMRPPLMVDPMGADTTYDAEMYKQINT